MPAQGVVGVVSCEPTPHRARYNWSVLKRSRMLISNEQNAARCSTGQSLPPCRFAGVGTCHAPLARSGAYTPSARTFAPVLVCIPSRLPSDLVCCVAITESVFSSLQNVSTGPLYYGSLSEVISKVHLEGPSPFLPSLSLSLASTPPSLPLRFYLGDLSLGCATGLDEAARNCKVVLPPIMARLDSSHYIPAAGGAATAVDEKRAPPRLCIVAVAAAAALIAACASCCAWSWICISILRLAFGAAAGAAGASRLGGARAAEARCSDG